MLAKLHALLSNLLTPFLRWAGNVHLPYTHKLVTGLQYYQAFPKLKKGSVFCSRIRGDLTTLLIPGFWTHVAGYTPQPSEAIDEIVTQAENVGVNDLDLVTFMTTKDDVVILEPNCLGDKKESIMARAADLMYEQLGKPYNFHFDFHLSTQSSFYCSELVWWAYDKACLEAGVPSLFKPQMTLGVQTVTPQDVATNPNFTVVWDSRNSA